MLSAGGGTIAVMSSVAGEVLLTVCLSVKSISDEFPVQWKTLHFGPSDRIFWTNVFPNDRLTNGGDENSLVHIALDYLFSSPWNVSSKAIEADLCPPPLHPTPLVHFRHRLIGTVVITVLNSRKTLRLREGDTSQSVKFYITSHNRNCYHYLPYAAQVG